MYRIHKTLTGAGAACVLAVTMACSSAPSSPASPGAVNTGDGALGPDNSTLKATAPGIVSPSGDTRLTNLTPTMVVNNARGSWAGATFTHEFQLMTDGGSVIASTNLTSGATTTSWVFSGNLERDTFYRWRARARMGDAFGPWSATARFITVDENRAPDPPPGQRLPFPSWGQAIVMQVAAERPDFLARSCQEHGGTWEFMDLVIDRLRAVDTRWGYNWKRGIVGDPSLDVINYHWGPGPDEGSRDNYTIDIIGQHCGPSPTPFWLDLTDPGGAGAVWTSRGRW